MIDRPGPSKIDAGRAPGGVVIHIYNRAGELLVESAVAPHDDVRTRAERDADLVIAATGELDTCLVAFDGDSGERMPWGAL